MRPLLPAALALSTVLLLLQPAGAQMSDADRARRWFLEHDRDRDGYVTLDEVMKYEAKLFNRMDREGTGRLREDEYCAGIPPANTVELDRCHTRFARIDANGDNYITLDEIQEFYRKVLDAADQNQDGRVSLDEWMAATQGQ